MKIDNAVRDFVQLAGDQMAKAGLPYRMRVVTKDELILLEKNARFFTPNRFKKLVANIEKDGQLASMPLVNAEGDKFRVISGNHRVSAGIQAGIEEFIVLEFAKDQTEDELMAAQLSHNALAGHDDQVILQELYESISSATDRLYSGLGDTDFDKLKLEKFDPLREVALDTKAVTVLFMPEEVDNLNQVLEKLQKHLLCDEAYLAPIEKYVKLANAIRGIKANLNIASTAIALGMIIELGSEAIEKQLAELAANDDTV